MVTFLSHFANFAVFNVVTAYTPDERIPPLDDTGVWIAGMGND